MAAVREKQMTAETFGNGVFNPMDFRQFAPEEATVVLTYGQDPDVGVVVWNLEPGQENSTHTHPDSAHVITVLAGSGEYLKDGNPVPIKAGDCLVVPRNVVHGIRNTGSERFSYMAVTNVSPTGYTRTPTSGGH